MSAYTPTRDSSLATRPERQLNRAGRCISTPLSGVRVARRADLWTTRKASVDTRWVVGALLRSASSTETSFRRNGYAGSFRGDFGAVQDLWSSPPHDAGRALEQGTRNDVGCGHCADMGEASAEVVLVEVPVAGPGI